MTCMHTSTDVNVYLPINIPSTTDKIYCSPSLVPILDNMTSTLAKHFKYTYRTRSFIRNTFRSSDKEGPGCLRRKNITTTAIKKTSLI